MNSREILSKNGEQSTQLNLVKTLAKIPDSHDYTVAVLAIIH